MRSKKNNWIRTVIECVFVIWWETDAFMLCLRSVCLCKCVCVFVCAGEPY